MIINQEILHATIKKWGSDAQLEMVKEECMELALAIQKYQRGFSQERLDNLIDEIADVNIMIAQANMLFDHEKIQERIDFKLNRLQNRIDRSEF